MVWTVLGYAILTDLATALGAVPFAWVRTVNERWQGMMTAIAGGMMVAASIFSLTKEGLRFGSVWLVTAGLVAGAVFIAVTAKWLEHNELPFEHLTGKAARQSWLLLLALFAHSFPEGVAIGVGFATGELVTGLLLAITIAIHNIPEGVALTLALRPKGVSIAKCAWYAILSSLPQPIAAAPAYLIATAVRPFLPFGLGFASGAMLLLVVKELVPDSLSRTTRSEAAWGFAVGLLFMMLFTFLV